MALTFVHRNLPYAHGGREHTTTWNGRVFSVSGADDAEAEKQLTAMVAAASKGDASFEENSKLFGTGPRGGGDELVEW